LFFFRLLHEELTYRGWDFEAWFMAKSEPGRYWRFEAIDFPFIHKFFPGFSPHLGGISFHLNPGVYREVRDRPPKILISGGAWLMPTTIISSFAPDTTLKVFWSESHALSLTHKNEIANRVRSVLMGRYDAFAVPGKLAREYVEQFAPAKTLLTLPNLVDNTVYGEQTHRFRQDKRRLREKYGIPECKRALLIPARLNPAKGILPFLDGLLWLSKKLLDRLTIILAGDGELRSDIESWILQHPSPTIKLLGHQNQPLMCELYALADGVALPSYSDPNPLAVIEALWAGLPLLLSDRVGNHYETLTPGSNGWLFTSTERTSLCKAVESFLLSPDKQLREYGEASYAAACRSFEPHSAVRSLLEQLIVLSQHH
jgi:glycosyltransferase involved in cell wall biosynthesis